MREQCVPGLSLGGRGLGTRLICYVFVSCVQRRVVEGSGVSSGGCIVRFDVYGE